MLSFYQTLCRYIASKYFGVSGNGPEDLRLFGLPFVRNVETLKTKKNPNLGPLIITLENYVLIAQSRVVPNNKYLRLDKATQCFDGRILRLLSMQPSDEE